MASYDNSPKIIRPLIKSDWDRVAEIYLKGICSGNATFETSCSDWEAWDENHRRDCRLVAVTGDQIAGWAALAQVSKRTVYSGVCEISIYVDPDFQGRGIGHLLIKHLIGASEEANIWTLQAGIFPENLASVALHTRNGFRKVGTREKIGQRHGVWRDVDLFERRSKVSGH